MSKIQNKSDSKRSVTVLQAHCSLPLRIFDFHLVVWHFHMLSQAKISHHQGGHRFVGNAFVSLMPVLLLNGVREVCSVVVLLQVEACRR